MHRKRDARRARDRCQKLKAREELAARESKTREELATCEELAKSEARQAREQREAWKKRDEMREFNKEFTLPETWPRLEVGEWKPILGAKEVSKMQTNDERATHVRLLFAAIGTPAPPLLGEPLLHAFFLRSSPHAPYLRGTAPRVLTKAPMKAKANEEKGAEPAGSPKPYFPPNSVSARHIRRSPLGHRGTVGDTRPGPGQREFLVELAHLVALLPCLALLTGLTCFGLR